MTTHQPSGSPTATKSWHRICVTVPGSLSEAIISFLCGITGQGVEQAEHGEEGETVTAYLPESADADKQLQKIKAFLAHLQQTLPPGQELQLSLSAMQDEDWNRKWKAHFRPEYVSPRLIIKPTWENFTPASGEKVIEMDPGMAFGTGHHASTRLSVQFIERLLQNSNPPQTVLDVGTGTGILAMAAVLLGAHSACAIDNDPEAVTAAADNVRRNGLNGKIATSGTDLKDVPGRFDLVIANIIHDTLVFLAPHLMEKMKSGGYLILAGILAGEQEKNIITVYTGLGLRHLATSQNDEWVALLFTDKLDP